MIRTLHSVSRLLALILALTVLPQCTSCPAEPLRDDMLCHEVFSELTDPSAANVARLIRGCETLRVVPGVVSLAAGARHRGLDSEVNQADFHDGLHVTFASRADHDAYQEHPVHLAFVEEHRHMWASVRVFDFVAGVPDATTGR